MKRATWMLTALTLLLGGLGQAKAGFINGNFGTGDLTGWTVFTTSNGTNGTLNGVTLPEVVSFDTTGTGATNSAHFNVGEVSFNQTQQGGGLIQDVILAAGSHTITGNFASQDSPNGLVNRDAGTFSVLLDGSSIFSRRLGGFGSPHQILRGTYQAPFDTTDIGIHQIEFLITRRFISADIRTPQEYLTNLSITGTIPAPEPASLTLLGLGSLGLLGYGRKRRQQAAA